MSSQPPLTPAEAAVVAVLQGESDCSWHIGCDEECHADRARAVVAAVRPLLAAESIAAFVDEQSIRYRKHSALAINEDIALAIEMGVPRDHFLSRPTSEETR